MMFWLKNLRTRGMQLAKTRCCDMNSNWYTWFTLKWMGRYLYDVGLLWHWEEIKYRAGLKSGP